MTVANFAAEQRQDVKEPVPSVDAPSIATRMLLEALAKIHEDLLLLQVRGEAPAPSVLFAGPVAGSGTNGIILNVTVRYRLQTLVIIDATGTATFAIKRATETVFTIPAGAAAPNPVLPMVLPLPLTLENGVEFQIVTASVAWTAYLIAYPDAALS